MGYSKNTDTKEPIIPVMPHVNPGDRQFKEIPYRPFIDYTTGEQYPNGKMDTHYYWKPLSELITDYMNHPEVKSDGDAGLLKRRYITIDETSIHYIGKESSELDEPQITGVDGANYTTYEDPGPTYKKILAMKEEDAPRIGISARTLYYWKAKIREGKKITLYDKVKAKTSK